MPNQKKYHVNPYLFLLAKRMLDYEFVGMEKEPSSLQLAHFIYERHTTPAFRSSRYSSSLAKRDSFAFGKAERIKKYILSPKDFYFTDEMLNQLVTEITKMDRYNSWTDFTSKHAADPATIVAERAYAGHAYSALSPDDRQRLISFANRKLYSLHFFNKRIDKGSDRTILHHKEEVILRTASEADLKEIELLAKRVYPCPINGADKKKEWFRKNPNIFFVYKDDYDLWGNVNLLPITQACYRQLKEGLKYEHEISPADIYNPDEKSKVKYIYVEGLACTIKAALLLIVKFVKEMLNALSSKDASEIIVCAIGGSEEGDQVMKKLKFKQTGWSKDPRTGNQYPFMEIKASMLITDVRKFGLISENIISQSKLTSYKNQSNQ